MSLEKEEIAARRTEDDQADAQVDLNISDTRLESDDSASVASDSENSSESLPATAPAGIGTEMNDTEDARKSTPGGIQTDSVPSLANRDVSTLSDAQSKLVDAGTGRDKEPPNIQLNVGDLLAEHRSALISRGLHRRGRSEMNRVSRLAVSKRGDGRHRTKGAGKRGGRRIRSRFRDERLSFSFD
jgi:hypothetical protein